MKIIFRLSVVVILVIMLDGATKFWAESALEAHQPVPVLGEFFRFTLGYNTGVAFGMFANGGPWPLLVTGLIIIGMTGWFTSVLYRGQFPAIAIIPVGLLSGGAIGNFVDRLFDGRVTDFLDVGLGTARWPTFNLADSFILIGVTVLLLLSFINEGNINEGKDDDTAVDQTSPESDSNSLFT